MKNKEIKERFLNYYNVNFEYMNGKFIIEDYIKWSVENNFENESFEKFADAFSKENFLKGIFLNEKKEQIEGIMSNEEKNDFYKSKEKISN